MTVSIEFLGAAREVTGSSILVRTGRTSFLVDCGIACGHINPNGEMFP